MSIFSNMTDDDFFKFKELFFSSSEEDQQMILSNFTDSELEDLEYEWRFWARPKQLIPKEILDLNSEKNIWLVLGGRGMGKTRMGSEAIRQLVCGKTPLAKGRYSRIGLIGETAQDVRDTLVKGPSGILAVHPSDFRPTFYSSTAEVVWPNGAIALLRNDTAPEALRGPNFDLVWVDEFAKFRNISKTYDQVNFSTRIGIKPVQIYTTTPRNVKTLKDLIDKPNVFLTRGTTQENAANLAKQFVKDITSTYSGTRLGRQELSGELLDDVEGALWNTEMISRNKGEYTPVSIREMSVRIVIGVDPTGTTHGDECGIVVCAASLDKDEKEYFVIEDASISGRPSDWARRVSAMYEKWGADRIIAEVNYGGDMVEDVLKQYDPELPIKTVHSTKGKIVRAEPISALYEQGRVYHNTYYKTTDQSGNSVGNLYYLENEMTEYTGSKNEKSPNRLDAMVFAMTELKGKKSRSKDELNVIRNMTLSGFYN